MITGLSQSQTSAQRPLKASGCGVRGRSPVGRTMGVVPPPKRKLLYYKNAKKGGFRP